MRPRPSPRSRAARPARAVSVLALTAFVTAGAATSPTGAASQEPGELPGIRAPEIRAHLPTAEARAEALAATVDSLVTEALVAPDAATRQALALRADSVARMLADVRPRDAESRFWTAVTAGTLADQAGAREKIALGRRAYDEASAALAMDSLHAGANHVVGRIHAGTMRLGWLTRLIAGRLGLGELLDEASWETAVHHLSRAVEGEPDRATYRVELARALLDTGRVAPAREELRRVLALDAADVLARREQERAREILTELEEQGPDT